MQQSEVKDYQQDVVNNQGEELKVEALVPEITKESDSIDNENEMRMLVKICFQ